MAKSWIGSPAATPRTIRARWTWNQGSDRLRAMSCKIEASWEAICRERGFRPRMGRLRCLDPVMESSLPTVPNFLHYFVPETLARLTLAWYRHAQVRAHYHAPK